MMVFFFFEAPSCLQERITNSMNAYIHRHAKDCFHANQLLLVIKYRNFLVVGCCHRSIEYHFRSRAGSKTLVIVGTLWLLIILLCIVLESSVMARFNASSKEICVGTTKVTLIPCNCSIVRKLMDLMRSYFEAHIDQRICQVSWV